MRSSTKCMKCSDSKRAREDCTRDVLWQRGKKNFFSCVDPCIAVLGIIVTNAAEVPMEWTPWSGDRGHVVGLHWAGWARGHHDSGHLGLC